MQTREAHNARGEERRKDALETVYYATFEDGGMIRRIAFTNGPNAEVRATPPYGDSREDLTIDFDASGSKDPNGDPSLTYLWDFDGDGTIDENTTTQTISNTYPKRGNYTATLTVRNSAGNTSDPAKIEIFPGDTPPEPTIDGLTEVQAQVEADSFKVDGDYTATGSATDPDGDAPVELKWEVVQRHDDNHEHPLENATGGIVTFSGPKPEGLYLTNPAENYVEVRLTATDALGLSKTVVRKLPPRTKQLTFKIEPAGLRLNIAGERVATSQTPTVTSWEGYDLNVLAPRQQKDGRTYAFQSWSDGGAAEHAIETPEQDTDYTATFRKLRR